MDKRIQPNDTIKIAVRKIYHRAITPSCDIIELNDETWRAFLYGNNLVRKQIVLKATGTIDSPSIREIAWIPLDGQDLIILKEHASE